MSPARAPRRSVLLVGALVVSACAGTGGATNEASASPTEATTTAELATYTKMFAAGGAGSLTYRLTGDRVELVEAAPAGGWQAEILEESDGAVSVAFREGGGDEVIATVALQDGRAIETVDVRDATPPPAPSEAGRGGDDDGDDRPGRGRGRDRGDDDDEDSDDD